MLKQPDSADFEHVAVPTMGQVMREVRQREAERQAKVKAWRPSPLAVPVFLERRAAEFRPSEDQTPVFARRREKKFTPSL